MILRESLLLLGIGVLPRTAGDDGSESPGRDAALSASPRQTHPRFITAIVAILHGGATGRILSRTARKQEWIRMVALRDE